MGRRCWGSIIRFMRFTKQKLQEAIIKGILFSEGLLYHVEKELSLSKNIFRPGSEAYFNLIREARHWYDEGLLEIDAVDLDLIKSDLGEWGVYEGRRVALDYPILAEIDDEMEEEFNLLEGKKKKKSGSYYQGKKVKLNKPTRNPGSSGGQYRVYVKDPKTGNVKKVTFGSREMRLRLSDPKARKSFTARHKCKETKDKTSARYWACRAGRYPSLTGSKSRYTWW